jgi:PIN domain nuclease of toxin-antitoxin system
LRLLLDTHVAFWLVAGQSELTTREWAVLRDPAHDLFLSAVSVWELRLKWDSLRASGERKGPIDPRDALDGFRRLRLTIIPLDADIAAMPLQQPMRHKDPFDQLLLVQAQEEGMRLFTRDENLHDHPLVFSPDAP